MPHEAWDLLEMADLAAKGLMPVAGGTLDQASVFLDACRFVWSEERGAKARLKLDVQDA